MEANEDKKRRDKHFLKGETVFLKLQRFNYIIKSVLLTNAMKNSTLATMGHIKLQDWHHGL